jgi:putative hydrolase of HD superfamily
MNKIDLNEPGWGSKLEFLVTEGKVSYEQASEMFSQFSTRKKSKTIEQDQQKEEDSLLSAKDVLSISKYCGDLKLVPRTGWVKRNVPNRIESVAEHSFRIGCLALLLNDDTLNSEKVISMGLIHDLAESIVGDIAPGQGISDDEKRKLEEQAMKTIMKTKLFFPAKHEKIMSLWEEYEARNTPESKVVKDLDRFELLLQADEYETANEGLDLSEFFQSGRGKILHPTIQKWFDALEARRDGRRGKLNKI